MWPQKATVFKLEIVLIFVQNSKLEHINVTKVPRWPIKLIPITNTTSMLNQALEILLWVNMLFFMSRPVFLLRFLIGLSLARTTLSKLVANMGITSILKSKLLVWLHRLIWHLAFIFWCTHRCLSMVSTLISLINVEPTLTDFEKFHPPQNKNPPSSFIDFLDFSTLHSSFIRVMY